MPFSTVEKWTRYGPATTVAGMLTEYADASVTGFVLIPAGDPLAQYERVAEHERVPEVREAVDLLRSMVGTEA